VWREKWKKKDNTIDEGFLVEDGRYLQKRDRRKKMSQGCERRGGLQTAGKQIEKKSGENIESQKSHIKTEKRVPQLLDDISHGNEKVN